MIVLKGYDKAKAATPGEFRKLTAGGYICKVVESYAAVSRAGRDMLVLYLDIAEGEFTDWFRQSTMRLRNLRQLDWTSDGIYRQVIFDDMGDCTDLFKGLMECFRASNPSLQFNPNSFSEKSLQDRLIGMVFAEREYEYRGKILTKVEPRLPKTVAEIREGKFIVPSIKRIEGSQNLFAGKSTTQSSAPVIDDEDIPF